MYSPLLKLLSNLYLVDISVKPSFLCILYSNYLRNMWFLLLQFDSREVSSMILNIKDIYTILQIYAFFLIIIIWICSWHCGVDKFIHNTSTYIDCGKIFRIIYPIIEIHIFVEYASYLRPHRGLQILSSLLRARKMPDLSRCWNCLSKEIFQKEPSPRCTTAIMQDM